MYVLHCSSSSLLSRLSLVSYTKTPKKKYQFHLGLSNLFILILWCPWRLCIVTVLGLSTSTVVISIVLSTASAASTSSSTSSATSSSTTSASTTAVTHIIIHWSRVVATLHVRWSTWVSTRSVSHLIVLRHVALVHMLGCYSIDIIAPLYHCRCDHLRMIMLLWGASSSCMHCHVGRVISWSSWVSHLVWHGRTLPCWLILCSGILSRCLNISRLITLTTLF
mmetsp:Transcript_14507/g.21612  ORF Transcript_14507/g.21612 Transcript_14507/m.21612 type:complete len:222 (+) Transcript_14507:119-784(+)